MQGTCLKIYLTEIQKHDGKLSFRLDTGFLDDPQLVAP